MTIFTNENIYKAYLDCLKHKKNTANALKFEIHREKNMNSLLGDLKTRRYKISRHICFIVTEPTPREIFAADFRDRVVHHLLFNEIKSLFEGIFIEESYANRDGKGTHKAVKKLSYLMRRGGVNGNKLFYLKMDIKGFFRNIDKNILYKEIKQRIVESNQEYWWKEEIMWLMEMIVFHDPASCYIFKGEKNMRKLVPKEKSLFFGNKNNGLPIGNLTSQFFANIYLNKLDHFIKDDLRFYRYVRYVDDFIIVDEDKEKLEKTIEKIDMFLYNELKLKLSPKKVVLRSVNTGVDFLGYYIKPTHILVRRKVVKRFKNKFYRINRGEDNFLPLTCLPMISSYVGHFKHANSYNLRQKLLNL